MVFFSYLLIPLIILISILIYVASNKGLSKAEYNPKRTFNYDYDNYLFSTNANEYKLIEGFLKNTSIISKDEDKAKKFQSYLSQKLNINVDIYSNEKSVDKSIANLILINYNKKKNSYEFSFKQKKALINSGGYMNSLENLFPFQLISSKDAIDLFSYFDHYPKNGEADADGSQPNYAIDSDSSKYNLQHIHFILYQSLISRFLIESEKGIISIDKNIHFQFGFNSYPKTLKDTDNYEILGSVFSYIVDIQYTLIFLSFTIQMLEEKEQKLKKLLERQGIGEVQYVLSWFINYLFVGLITDIVLIITMIILMKTLQWLFILNIILFVLAQFPLMYLIVIICSTKKKGLILVNIVCFTTLVVGFILRMGTPSRALQIVLNIFPNINEFSMLNLIFKYEQIGVYSSDLLKLRSNKISYIDDLIMFFVEICFYSLICLFIISFQNSGLPFLDFLKSFCSDVNRKIKSDGNEISSDNDANNTLIKNHEELTSINLALKKDNKFLNIKNITKNYGDLKAVNNFCGELFKNEIFVLLGHNGAGKTTLIKMISGTEDPDNGDIFLDGISIITNKSYLYQNIGLCQQDDILFSYLTVEEHLEYMMELKGSKSDQDQINLFINKIDLASKKDTMCKNLSGGEKRKLCIAIALIGNSQLVLLDEPTSGMDVIAKRKLWTFLKEFKNDKIIILTTHSLDEAEYLGDRIGIMSGGQFICSGTSSYLKSKYPCGFNLNFLVNSEIFDNSHKRELYKKLAQYQPNLEVKISSKGLFSVNIESNNKNVKEIFKVIEEYREEYGIEDYTVSSTTLEDVFLKLNHKINIAEENKEVNNDEILVRENSILIKPSSFFTQLISHIKRGIFSIWRNKSLFILELIIGLFVLYIYVIIHYNTLNNVSKLPLNFAELLENNDIFVCKNDINFFKSSYVYDELCSISLKEIDNKSNIDEFIEEVYQNALANIGKASICLKEVNTNTYEIFNTEVPLEIPAYMMANIMLSVSAFLKKEYDINAAILYEIVDSNTQEIGNSGVDVSELSTMFSLSFACIISLCIYLGTIMSEKIKERTKNIKHILYLSGSNLWSYWCGFYVVDLIKLLIFSSLAAAILYVFNNFASFIWIDLIITSFSTLCFVYFLSFILSKEESGQKSLLLIVFGLLILFAVVLIILVSTGKDFDVKFMMNKYNFTIFDITPITSFLLSYLRLVFSYTFFSANFFENLTEFEIPLFGKIYKPKEYILTSLMVQAINLVFYFLVIILFESSILEECFNYIKVKLMRENNITFSNPQINNDYYSDEVVIKNENELNSKDEFNIRVHYQNQKGLNNINQGNGTQYNNYVQNEINKVNSDQENKLTTKIIGLKKTYWMCCSKNIRAINNLYLGLENNEKFGLLGFNGSGKTTTFKTITKEILYDSGSIQLFGKDTKSQFEKIRNSIGYCPQENPIFDYMKVREMISFYLDLKKINESTESICEKFGLSKFLDTYCINLSGGNKRKLSFAIALMCKPKLLLLDEPSSGVDPESRRIMWKNILELNRAGNKFNMILTTHSMEEAEVLCDTVSWLKSGNFISIGNPEKLKIALSAGYKLHIKFAQLNQISDNNLYNKAFSNLSSMVNGFIISNENMPDLENIKPHLIELEKVIESIKDKCSEIKFEKLNKDFSFEFKIKIIKEKQSDLFVQVLDMKNTNNLLSEISISMESLENILTRL